MEDNAIDVRGFLQGATQCEMRSDPPPAVIYASRESAMGGNEEFVNDSGAYFKQLADVLIFKNYREVLQPWTHEIELSVPAQSIFKLVIQAEFAESMSVRVVAGSSSKRVDALFHSLHESQTGFEVLDVKELTYIFDLSPNTQYFVVIEFYGDMNSGGAVDANCAYFNLVLSIQSLPYLHSQMICDEGTRLAKLTNLPSKTVSVIQQGVAFTAEKPFEQRGMYTLKYPDDLRNAQENDGMLMVSQRIQATSPFELSGAVFFDLPFSDWQISLFNVPDRSSSKVEESMLRT